MQNQTQQIIDQALDKVGKEWPEELKVQMQLIFTKLLENTETPQKVFEVPDYLMEACYTQAYNRFKAGRYQEAIKTFESLRFLNPLDSRYTLGIAASYHYLKNYTNAAANYLLYKESDPFNPLPAFYLYDCLNHLNQPLLAANALAEVIVKAQDNPLYSSIREKALLEKESLTYELKEWLEKNYENLPKKINHT